LQTQGWVFSLFDGPPFTNLAVGAVFEIDTVTD